MKRRTFALLIWLLGSDERTMQRDQERYDRKRGTLATKYGEEYWKQRNGTNVKRKAEIERWDWLVLTSAAGLVLVAGLAFAWWRLA